MLKLEHWGKSSFLSALVRSKHSKFRMLLMMGLTVSAECEDYDDDLYERKAFGDTKLECFFC